MSLPPKEIPLGAMRFNSDSQKLEYWMGSAWMQIHTFSPNLAESGDVAAGVRAIVGGGATPSKTNIIQFVTISTSGDATDFGDLLDERDPDNSQICSHTRGLFVGGENPGPSACKLVDKITIATTGNATNFGDIRTSTSQSAGCSDSHGGLS